MALSTENGVAEEAAKYIESTGRQLQYKDELLELLFERASMISGSDGRYRFPTPPFPNVERLGHADSTHDPRHDGHGDRVPQRLVARGRPDTCILLSRPELRKGRSSCP